MPSDFKLPLPPPLRHPTDGNPSLYPAFSSSASFYTISSPSASFSDSATDMSFTRSPDDVRHYPRYNLPSMIHQPSPAVSHNHTSKYTPYPPLPPHPTTETRASVTKARWSRSSLPSSSSSPVPETMIPRSRQPHRKRQFSSSSATGPKECYSCHSTETPEWRRGPLGPRTLCNACGLIWAKLAKQNGKQHVDTSSSQRNSWVSHNGVKLSPQLIPRSRSPCHVEPVPSRTPTTTSESNAASANKCAISYLLS